MIRISKLDKKQQAAMLAQKITNNIKQGDCLKNENRLNELLYDIEELQQVTVGIYAHHSQTQLIH